MFRRKPRRPRTIFIRTRDGWSLASYRYWKGPGTSRFGPVLLVHGLGANRANLDAPDPRISLAQYLAERGHDVWVIELRGAGRSRPPRWPLRWRAPWDFDDYVHLDVPAIIRRVLDESRASAVHWVGHSMGGMLGYAALEHFDQRLFRSVVTVAAPGFTGVKHPLVDQLYKLRFLLEVFPWVPYREASVVASFFPGLLSHTVGRLVANPEQMERKHVRMLARTAVTNLPAPLLAQFADWYGRNTGFRRWDGLLEYHEHLNRIQVPILIIAGAADVLTPVSDLQAVYALIPSAHKKILVCGKEQGFLADYGHIDLILGHRAREEVYPHVADWIEAHAVEAPPAAERRG